MSVSYVDCASPDGGPVSPGRSASTACSSASAGPGPGTHGVARRKSVEHARQFYIGGTWVAPLTSETIDVINPATEEAITSIAMGSEQDVDAAVAAARSAFETFSLTSRGERLALLDTIIPSYSSPPHHLAYTTTQQMP